MIIKILDLGKVIPKKEIFIFKVFFEYFCKTPIKFLKSQLEIKIICSMFENKQDYLSFIVFFSGLMNRPVTEWVNRINQHTEN